MMSMSYHEGFVQGTVLDRVLKLGHVVITMHHSVAAVLM